MPTHLQLVENKYILQKTLITLFLHNHVTNKQHIIIKSSYTKMQFIKVMQGKYFF